MNTGRTVRIRGTRRGIKSSARSARRLVPACRSGIVFLATALFLSPVLAQDGITGIFDVTLQGVGDNSLLIGQLEITDDSHEFEPVSYTHLTLPTKA